MAKTDYRRAMSKADFVALRVDMESPIDSYYDALILQNDRIRDTVFEDDPRLLRLTEGQRMLVQLSTFDAQVKNGGLTQFFWNYPESVFDVADWLERLGLAPLHANYERALESLIGNKDQWLTLRQAWADSGDNPRWESFQETYDLLDLDWFDDAYFDRYGDNGKVSSRGLKHELANTLAGYIRSHPSDFIVE